MYNPLPEQLELKQSSIHGYGIFTTQPISRGTILGISHVYHDLFPDGWIRTPLGGFYNHSNDPNIIRMVSDVLPKLRFGDPVDPNVNKKQLKETTTTNQNIGFQSLWVSPDESTCRDLAISCVEIDFR